MTFPLLILCNGGLAGRSEMTEALGDLSTGLVSPTGGLR